MASPPDPAGSPPLADALSRRTLLVAFLAALAIFVATAWVADNAASRAQADLAWVAHTQQLQRSAMRLEAAALQMEAEHRAFLVTGDERFARSRDIEAARAAQALAQLTQLTGGNIAQQARLERIENRLSARRQRMLANTELADSQGIVASRLNFKSTGPGSLDPLQAELEALGRDETTLLEARLRRAADQAHRFRIALLWAPGIGTLLLVVGLAVLYAQLRRSEQLLEQLAERSADAERALGLVDATSDAVLVFNADSLHMIYANLGASRQLGYERRELLHKSILDIKTEFSEAQLREKLAPLRQCDASMLTFEAVHRRQDGVVIPVEVSARFVQLADGEPSFVTVARDLSERHAAEDERDRFFALSLDMLCIASPEGRFIRVNPAFTQALGWSAEELTSRPFLDFVHPDDHVATTREVERQVRDGQPVLHFENRYRHKDGSWRLLSWRSAPHPSGLMFATARDVTEQNQAETALRESEARLRVVVDSAYDAFILMDADGKVLEWSRRAEETFGWPTGEAVGQPLADLIVPPEQRDAHRFGLARYMASGQSRILGRVIEVTARHRRGHDLPVELNVSPIRRGGTLIFGAFLREISERKQGEKRIAELNRGLEQRTVELEAANKELESFSYSVSHDLRAPLRHIDGFARMLVEDSADRLDVESRRYLAVIADSARHMGQLIDDLLSLARLGRKAIEPRAVDMRVLAEEALSVLEPTPGTVSIAELPPAVGDPVLLKQLWVNLLANAIKYSAGRGAEARIDVSGVLVDGSAEYCVRDNGVGFDMRYAGKLFGVFQRLHSPEEFEGTGVGLAIVQRVVTRHGGSIRAEAELGRGARFIFQIPLRGTSA